MCWHSAILRRLFPAGNVKGLETTCSNGKGIKKMSVPHVNTYIDMNYNVMEWHYYTKLMPQYALYQ